ncbi:MAG: hypothetical protein JWQ50_8076 [Caballeronia mineralivorans]|jgi:hypothetical protein|nr:hypothetical protein [Caballeronia mineralivorans]MEA3101173.1 hypothetical protein [Caballeronia mineralivorans]
MQWPVLLCSIGAGIVPYVTSALQITETSFSRHLTFGCAIQ